MLTKSDSESFITLLMFFYFINIIIPYKLLTSYAGTHGGSVGGQFEDTWNGESADEQNGNAMEMIIDTLQDLADSEMLSDWAQRDLVEYLDKVKGELGVEDDRGDEGDGPEDIDDNQNIQEQILKDFKRFL